MPAAVTPAEARRLWTFIEPIHAVAYFCPQPRAAFEAANLRGFWRGYFAGRSAPLGPVDAAPVIALFYVFAPRMVTRALPDVWTRAEPAAALRARVEGSAAALSDALTGDSAAGAGAAGDSAAGAGEFAGAVKAAADLLAEVAAAVDIGGRALAAANAALPVPDGDLARLWHLCTVLREHRGDGHMASLLTAGVDGCAALRWREAYDGESSILQTSRGWTDEEWAAAGERLADLGWLDAAGAITPAGRQRHDQLEEQTDRLAAQPWAVLAEHHRERLTEVLAPITDAAVRVLPYPNAVGVPRPA
jgi:hypothetical protein